MDCFEEKYVNEGNIELLWKKLREIQAEFPIRFDNYNVSEAESLCFYKQIQYIAELRWNGREINDEISFGGSYSSIPKMNMKQFEYYMYYRTRMLDSNYFMPSWMGYVYTFLFELSTGIENVSIEEINAILDYWRHITENSNDYIYSGLNHKVLQWKDNIIEIYKWKQQGIKPANCTSAHFENIEISLLEGVAGYSVQNSAFINDNNLLNQVQEVLDKILIRLENFSKIHDIDLNEFLVGKLDKSINYNKYLSNSIWTDKVKSKFLPSECAFVQYNHSHIEQVDIIDQYGNTIRRTNMLVRDVEINIALYILKSIESAFRLCTGYYYKLKKPAIDVSTNGIETRIAEGKIRYYSSDQRKRCKQSEFLKRIPDILKIIDDTIVKYISENKILFDNVRQAIGEKESTSNNSKKISAKSKILNLIELSGTSKNMMHEVLDTYDKVSETEKKSQYKFFQCVLLDYWVLHNQNGNFAPVYENIKYNKLLFPKMYSVANRDFKHCYEYFSLFYDLKKGAMKKYYSQEMLETMVCVTMEVIDRICACMGIDVLDLYMGEWETSYWKPYGEYFDIDIKDYVGVCVNVGNIIIYSVDSNGSFVKTFKFTELQNEFITMVLKTIDNSLRTQTLYGSLLKISDCPIEITQQLGNSFVETLPNLVSEIVISLQTRILLENIKYEKSIPITNKSEREYKYKCDISIDFDSIDYKGIIKDTLTQYCEDKNDLTNADVNSEFEQISIAELITTGITYPETRQKYYQRDMFDGNWYFLRNMETYAFSLSRIYISYKEFDFLDRFYLGNTKVMSGNDIFLGNDTYQLRAILNGDDSFYYWIKMIEDDEIFVFPENKTYITILFYFILNSYIFKNEREKALKIMCGLWNHYINDSNVEDKDLAIILGWIIDYWRLYCISISRKEFGSYFKYEIVFKELNAEDKIEYPSIGNINRKLSAVEIMQFYNAISDYKAIHGKLYSVGAGKFLEGALYTVHYKMYDLWRKYGLDFNSYLPFVKEVYEDEKYGFMTRAVLTKETIESMVHKQLYAEGEIHTINLDYDAPVDNRLCYDGTKVYRDITAGKRLIEYILKSTEIIVRKRLGFDYKGLNLNVPDLRQAFMGTEAEVLIKNLSAMDSLIETNVKEYLNNITSSINNWLITHQRSIPIVSDVEVVTTKNDLSDVIDEHTLQSARKVLYKNQERLVIENEEKQMDDVSNSNDSDKESLSELERALIETLLYHDDVREFEDRARNTFYSLNMLIESVNNKAIEMIGDVIIENDNGKINLVKDYITICEKWVNTNGRG